MTTSVIPGTSHTSIPSSIPSFIYGTAWKEDESERLVRAALEAGFRAIDTANQRKHYNEVAVGKALSAALQDGTVKQRDDLFIQTKFTSLDGQDHRIPYHRNADAATQVRQSFESSLEHLHVDRLDSYVLHGPSSRFGISDTDREVWQEMEAIQTEGGTRFLGVSNVGIEQLEILFESARVKPAFVQNRCYAQMGWDYHVREFCRDHGIVYQGFSLLTANPFVLTDPRVQRIAQRESMIPAQVVFRFARQIGMLPLTGTTDEGHMKLDLASESCELSEDEVRMIEFMAVRE